MSEQSTSTLHTRCLSVTEQRDLTGDPTDGHHGDTCIPEYPQLGVAYHSTFTLVCLAQHIITE